METLTIDDMIYSLIAVFTVPLLAAMIPRALINVVSATWNRV